MPRTFDVGYKGRTVDVTVPDDYTDEQAQQVLKTIYDKMVADAPADEPRAPEGKVDGNWEDDLTRLGGIATRGAVRTGVPAAIGTAIGAGVGMLGGPAAPITVPAGAFAGNLIGGFAEPIADAGAWAFNKLRGKTDYKPPSAYVDDLLDKKFPHPDNTGERMLETGTGALTSTAGSIVTAGRALARAPGALSRMFAANPGAQMVSAPVGAATAQGVGEATDNPWVGIGAGIAAGTATNMRLPPPLDLGVPDPRAVRNVDTDLALSGERVRGRDLERMYARRSERVRASDLYDRAERAGVQIDPAHFRGHLGVMNTNLRGQRFVPDNSPRVNAALRNISTDNDNAIAAGRNRSLQDLEIDRGRLLDAISGLDPLAEAAQIRHGNIAIADLDNFIDNLNHGRGLVSGDASVAIPILRRARATYRRAATADEINRIMDKARNQASGFSQAGMENAVRTQFRALADSGHRMSRFSPAEKTAIRRIARGDKLQHVLRYLGKFSPNSTFSTTLTSALGFGAGTLLAGIGGGPAGALGLMAAGKASHEAAARLRVRRANDLQDMVLTGRRPDPSVLGVRQFNGPLRGAMETVRANDRDGDEYAEGGQVDDFAGDVLMVERKR